MDQQQVKTTVSNNHNCKIKSAIDILLSSDSVKVEEQSFKLTECSPDIDVIINKQGGICTKCNSMFKSRSSLLNHLTKCLSDKSLDEFGYISNDMEDNTVDDNIITLKTNPSKHNLTGNQLKIESGLTKNRPKLVIVSP